MTALLREELMENSVLQKIREALPEYGLVLATQIDPTIEPGNANIHLRLAFPTPEERAEEMKITTVAFGFNIDDGGREMELGSTLTEYTHTLEVWTFATDPAIGRRVAHAIKHIARHGDDTIDLLDFGQKGNPQIDSLLVMKAQVQHVASNSARPWDQYLWTTSVVVMDSYYP